jgi:ribosomal protein S18 acetylase RimI-like enzyme
MISVREDGVISGTSIRELAAAEFGAHFAGIDPSAIALGLVRGESANEALAFADDAFDSAELGLRIGRIVALSARSTAAASALLQALAAHARRHGYQQVLRRTALSNLQEIWALESCGFEVMDVGLTFARVLGGPLDTIVHDDLLVRVAAAHDVEAIIPAMLDVPWATRYESDPRYERARVRQLRAQWLFNSLRGRADAFFVGILDGRPAGYVTCAIDRRSGHGQIDLVGTLPAFRGRRVAARILAHAMSWFSARTSFVTVRTQATNVAAAALYEKARFTLHSSDMTLRLTVDHPSDPRPSSPGA